MPDFVSQLSWRSTLGVVLGVVLTLSTRLCLDPDRGVTLLFKKADIGDTIPSLSLSLSLSLVDVPLLLSKDSGRGARLGIGVTTPVWLCCVVAEGRAAIFGVRGGLLTALATVGIWGPPC